MKILIIDDEHSLIQALKQAILGKGPSLKNFIALLGKMSSAAMKSEDAFFEEYMKLSNKTQALISWPIFYQEQAFRERILRNAKRLENEFVEVISFSPTSLPFNSQLATLNTKLAGADIVLLDEMMPTRGGVVRPHLGKVPVIAITSEGKFSRDAMFKNKRSLGKSPEADTELYAAIVSVL